jgi:hypothetical protein
MVDLHLIRQTTRRSISIKSGVNLHLVAWRLAAPTPLVSFVGSTVRHSFINFARCRAPHNRNRETRARHVGRYVRATL